MRTPTLVWLCFLALAGVTPAQFTLAFSVDGTETAANGLGGTSVSPGNYAAIFRDEALLLRSPGSTGSAVPCAQRSTWATWFGDEDGDGNVTEGVLGNLDALDARAGASNPPTVFDFWLSAADNAGPGGVLGAATVLDGDVFRIVPGGGVVFFIREAQIRSAIASASDLDVNGFARNPATGDLFITFTTTQTVNGVPLDDGGLIRIPGSAVTLAANGTVLSVVAGSAQIALFEINADILFAGAGLPPVGDLDGIALDPAGGTFVGAGGVALPNLWLAADNGGGLAVVSTRMGGQIATANGTNLSGAAAFGLAPTDFQGGPNSTVTALSWVPTTLTQAPRILDIGLPDIITPTTVTAHVGGFTPGPNLIVAARLAAPGSFTPRTSLTGTSLQTPGGFLELYITDFTDPFVMFTFNEPPGTIDSQGYGSRSWTLPPIAPGLTLVVQAYDAAAGALATPVTVKTL